jgi:hypothetical protein
MKVTQILAKLIWQNAVHIGISMKKRGEFHQTTYPSIHLKLFLIKKMYWFTRNLIKNIPLSKENIYLCTLFF